VDPQVQADPPPRAGEAAIADHPIDQIDITDEIRDEPGARTIVDLCWRADLLEAACVHDRYAVRHGEGLLLIVSDKDKRHTQRPLQLFQLDLHGLSQLAVECPKWLVAKEHRWADYDGTSERDALLLTSRELRRAPIVVSCELDLLQRSADPIGDLVLRNFPHTQAERHVLGDGPMWQERIGLEHHSHVAAVDRDTGEIALPHSDRTLVGNFEACDHSQGGGLPASRGAEEREEFPRLNAEVDVVDCRHCAGETLRDALECDRGGGQFERGCGWWHRRR
jgi:hypothetical protein